MLQTPDSYQNYELLIQNLRTIDTKPTNYQSFLLQTPDSKITNYQSFLIQTLDSNITKLPILFVSVDKIKSTQVMLGERYSFIKLPIATYKMKRVTDLEIVLIERAVNCM